MRPDRVPVWIAPVLLYVAAVLVRAWAASQVTFPPTEVSAYYISTAANLVHGRGLVNDAIWSYASAPLQLPQPAFSLWMPLASILAAIPLAVMGGAALPAAQLSSIVLGGLVAPLTWLVAREAASFDGLGGRRASILALGCGLVAAVLGPFLVAVVGPDSSVPFTVFAVAACWVMPKALGLRWEPDEARGWRIAPNPRRMWGLLLGLLLALTYLARQEAIWLGLAYLVLAAQALRHLPRGVRRAWLGTVLGLPVLAGALGILPWLVRQVLVFGAPFPGQAVENLWLTRNEQVFAYAHPATATAFLAQDPGTIALHIGTGLWHNLVNDLLLPTLPVAAAGLLALVWLWRAPALTSPTSLRAVTLGGGLIFVATGALFPIATVWGTFLHAEGPALVALVVLAGLGVDRLVARVGTWRHWDKQNAWLAPLVLLALAVPTAGLEVWLTAGFAAKTEARLVAAATEVGGSPLGAGGAGTVLISDHPIWLAGATHRSVIVLPDEAPADVVRLARDFGAAAVLVFGDRADASASLSGAPCLTAQPVASSIGPDARLYLVERGCTP